MNRYAKISVVAATTVAVAVGSVASAVQAQAAERFINGTVVAGLGLNVHSGSPTGAVIDNMPYGSTATMSCWVSGPSITGPFGTTSVWDAVEGYVTPSGQSITFSGGTRVFSSDAWIDTGGDTSKLLPHC